MLHADHIHNDHGKIFFPFYRKQYFRKCTLCIEEIKTCESWAKCKNT